MRRIHLILLAVVLGAIARPAQALIIPDPWFEPGVREAALAFVRALPIRGSFGQGQTVAARLSQELLDEAARRHPGLDRARLEAALRPRIGLRVDRLLAETWPALEEEIAHAFAIAIGLPGLTAGAEFYRTPGGRILAFRAAAQDPLIADILYRRLRERLLPELETILAEAERSEQLRARINAGARR